ncbi:hypothetical protein [Hymenobacter weizhouensis]|uniref:hypothetical protein n=1 Tax=Hymenobacter sp. YIM 151500-1 TaxID=2987689 RepID=UPI00222762FF|nr:hypothetical protein [Hymenobacter sp. YIM 151500-1]UYZ64689.1 hypothetical protein OIS53_07525 [Hymenobacter sp. YIM 151500-1]
MLFLLLVIGAANRRQSFPSLPEGFSFFSSPQAPAPAPVSSWEVPVRQVSTSPSPAYSTSAL